MPCIIFTEIKELDLRSPLMKYLTLKQNAECLSAENLKDFFFSDIVAFFLVGSFFRFRF